MLNKPKLDRLGHERSQVITRLDADGARVLLWHDGRFLMRQHEPVLFSLADLPGDARISTGPVYLGSDQGMDYLACSLVSAGSDSADQAFVGLREAGLVVDEFWFELLFYAQGLLNWHARNPFCAQCGGRTEATGAGHSRQCVNPGCGRTLYPKIDPAVIFSITRQSADGPRILLARKPGWNDHRHSVVAGFVEPGERLEDAVRREAWEETGLVVEQVEYTGSQPWPFPDALMVGFNCFAQNEDITLIDGELASARWYSTDQIETGLRDGSLSMPYRRSIAWQLIDRWFSAHRGSTLDSVGG